MEWVIAELIAFLSDLKTDPLFTQILTLAGIPALFALIISYPNFALTRKVRDSVVEYNKVESRLKTAVAEAAKLQSEIDRLGEHSPEKFLIDHAREVRDQNDERSMQFAEHFLAHQEDALELAFRTRMDEAIRQSIEDGIPAFHNALNWARAAFVFAPQDETLSMLIDDLTQAISSKNTALPDDNDRRTRQETYERLPNDLKALSTAFYRARDNGEYAIMFFLANHGMMITRREPYGKGSSTNIISQMNRAEALILVGRSRDALSEIEPLISEIERQFGSKSNELYHARIILAESCNKVGNHKAALAELENLLLIRKEVQGERHPDVLITRFHLVYSRNKVGDHKAALAEFENLLPIYEEVQGERHPDVLNLRYHLAECRNDVGDHKAALAELENLLPIYEEVQGERHPDVLSTRSLLAECRNDVGDHKAALAELENLLPIYVEVLGERHPRVLSTRYRLAECRNDVGDHKAALAELENLLPMRIVVHGERHPSVLRTRIIMADCRIASGNTQSTAELQDIRMALVEAGLLETHRYFTELSKVEQKISETK